MKRYKIYGHSSVPISKTTLTEVASSKKFSSYLKAPAFTPDHHIYFTGAMVRSGANKNMAWFDQPELLKAYDSVRFNAVDIDHEQEKNCGVILDHIFLDIANKEVIDRDMMMLLSEEEQRKTPIDVIILANLWADRYPMYADVVENKRTSLSMEVYFSNFLVRLDNGVTLTIEEAASFGLSDFVDKLLGNFADEEDFINSHTLNVTTADAKVSPMRVYKHLLSMSFSGVALTQFPACNTCNIFTTSKDPEENLSMAASREIFSLDLRKVDSYMRAVRDGKGIGPITFQVREDIKCGCPDNDPENAPEQAADSWTPSPPPNLNPPTGAPRTPGDYTNLPTACPQYQLDANMWCLFANKQCVTAGDRSFKDCHRWLKDPSGRWLFDTRNTIDTEEDIVISDIMGSEAEEVEVETEQACCKSKASLNYTLQAAEYALEAWEAKKDTGAVWTTKMVNGFPNSSFAVIETGYKEGMNKNARHLPFKDGSGEVDLAHLRNARARANQIKSVLGNDTDAELRKRAMAKLEPYAKRYLNQDQEGGA